VDYDFGDLVELPVLYKKNAMRKARQMKHEIAVAKTPECQIQRRNSRVFCPKKQRQRTKYDLGAHLSRYNNHTWMRV